MRKSIVSLAVAAAFVAVPTAAHATVPDCSASTPVGATCVMPPAVGPGDPDGMNLIEGLDNAISSLTQNFWDENAVVAERDVEIYNLKAHYHSVLEVLRGRFEGYKDQIRWDRHELKRLRAQLRALQG